MVADTGEVVGDTMSHGREGRWLGQKTSPWHCFAISELKIFRYQTVGTSICLNIGDLESRTGNDEYRNGDARNYKSTKQKTCGVRSILG